MSIISASSVSVVMATYNGEKYIRQQLDSILSQSVMPAEIIIQDDCSSDSTQAIIQEYAANNGIVKVFLNDHNLGFRDNFSSACTKARCEYIALADQDDIWLPDHLKVLLETIKDKTMACAEALLVDADNNSMGITFTEVKDMHYLPETDLSRSYRMLYGSYGGFLQGASMLFRRSMNHIIFPIPQGVRYHDVWITLVSCFAGGFNFCPEIITRYRQHDSNVSDNIRPSFFREMKRHTHFDFVPDRIDAVNAVRDRVKGLDSDATRILDEFQTYSKECFLKGYRLKCWKCRSAHYHEIYSTSNNRLKIFRALQYILTPPVKHTIK